MIRYVGIPGWSYFAKSNLKIGRKVIIAKIASLEGLKETETGSLSLLETDDVWMIHLFPRQKLAASVFAPNKTKATKHLYLKGSCELKTFLFSPIRFTKFP